MERMMMLLLFGSSVHYFSRSYKILFDLIMLYITIFTTVFFSFAYMLLNSSHFSFLLALHAFQILRLHFKTASN